MDRRQLFQSAISMPFIMLMKDEKKYDFAELMDMCPENGCIETPANYDPGYDLCIKIITREKGQRPRHKILHKFRWDSPTDDETGSLWVKI